MYYLLRRNQMIDKNDDIQQRNIDLLIAGYWYEDLPPVIDIANIKGMIKGIIEKIDNDVYDDFFKTDGLITEYKILRHHHIYLMTG